VAACCLDRMLCCCRYAGASLSVEYLPVSLCSCWRLPCHCQNFACAYASTNCATIMQCMHCMRDPWCTGRTAAARRVQLEVEGASCMDGGSSSTGVPLSLLSAALAAFQVQPLLACPALIPRHLCCCCTSPLQWYRLSAAHPANNSTHGGHHMQRQHGISQHQHRCNAAATWSAHACSLQVTPWNPHPAAPGQPRPALPQCCILQPWCAL
jgi:hypothetical protein